MSINMLAVKSILLKFKSYENISLHSILVSGRLDDLCERLVFGDVTSVLEPRLVCGESVRHNMTQLTSRGVVKVMDGHPEDLPNWILTAMKCLAQCGLLGCASLCAWMDRYIYSLVCHV